jgi:hypothetical protein
MGRSCASSSLDTIYTEPPKIRIGAGRIFFRPVRVPLGQEDLLAGHRGSERAVRTSDLRFGVHHQSGVTVAHPVGVLDAGTYPEFRDTLLRYAAEQPDALIVDVDHLDMPAAHALTVFSLVSFRVADWPGVPVLVVARDELRRSVLAAWRVGVYASLVTALTAVVRPPARPRAEIELAASPLSTRRARYFVRMNCYRWNLACVATDAMTVVTAFVENTLLHTDSGALLRMELRHGTLAIAVSDDDPAPAVLRERSAGGVPPSGLLLVSGVTRTWGCTPAMTGKAVWAVLPVPSTVEELRKT